MKKPDHTIENKRHSLAHVLAMAVLSKYPDAKLGIGPIIDNGFYYDFDIGKNFKEEELAEFESAMRDILAHELDITGKEITLADAKKLFKGQPYKLELAAEYAKENKRLTTYTTGDFTDLCKGGHIENTRDIDPDAFRLTRIAGAYWRGDEKNPQLSRIYGVSFETKQELAAHLEALEEAQKRDHRKLGRELGLFVFSDLVGPGLPLYTPKGTRVLTVIKNFSRKLRQEMGYQEVATPQINKGELFKISGHYDKYKENLFRVASNYTEEEYFLKPMNCPQHTQLYAAQLHSYKDLPIRFADFAMLYRDEKPGELSGLTRLRAFSQDDAHCFLREDQLAEELAILLGAIQSALRTYNLPYDIRLSLWDEENKSAFLGGDAIWKKSQQTLQDLLREKGLQYESAEGEAVFYGPKLDFISKDSLGREWQISTIQLDFNLPERFGLEYIGEDGTKRQPIMIHSAIVGSPERFLGVLLEYYAGALPFWLSPVQIKILTINEKVADYGENIARALEEKNFFIERDFRNESIGKKIREAEIQKIPYLLVIGEKEASNNTIAVRERAKGDLGQMSIDKFLNLI